MTIISPTDDIGKQICDALGLKYVRKLTLIFEAASTARVIAEMYLDKDGVSSLPVSLKKYRLELLSETELED